MRYGSFSLKRLTSGRVIVRSRKSCTFWLQICDFTWRSLVISSSIRGDFIKPLPWKLSSPYQRGHRPFVRFGMKRLWTEGYEWYDRCGPSGWVGRLISRQDESLVDSTPDDYDSRLPRSGMIVRSPNPTQSWGPVPVISVLGLLVPLRPNVLSFSPIVRS